MNIDKVSLTAPVQHTQYTPRVSSPRLNKMSGVGTDMFIKNNSPAFTGDYFKELEIFARTFYKSESDIEKQFHNVFTALMENPRIQKFAGFDELAELYSKRGMRGLLYEFWKAESSPSVQKILSKANEHGDLALAGDDALSVLSLNNMGRHGFINYMTDNPNAPRNIELSFSGPYQDELHYSNFVSVSLAKNQDLAISQRSGLQSSYREYYATVGRIRKEVEHGEYSNEITYYKKNGELDDLKNWFFGGTVNLNTIP